MNLKVFNVGKANAILTKYGYNGPLGVHVSKANRAIEELAAKLPEDRRQSMQRDIEAAAPASRKKVINMVVPRGPYDDAGQTALINAQSEIASLKARITTLESKPAPAPTNRRDPKILGAAYGAAFGRPGQLSLDRVPDDERVGYMERQVYYAGLKVEGYDFTHVEQQFGAAKPLHGLQRVQAATQQQLINSALARA